MRDFTLEAYKIYLRALRASYSNILRFDDFLKTDPSPDRFCLIRHDVDRFPRRALKMANVEHKAGIQATYYFRAKPHVFNPDIIQSVEKLGHEIGYHYESLSDANGDMSMALKYFEKSLNKFNKYTTIQTISMHGRPFNPFDNRDMWRDPGNHGLLSEKYGVLGEIYLDIDYRDIAYINDTGRNWFATKNNKKDTVNSLFQVDLKNGDALHRYLKSASHPKIVLQIHPERWTDSLSGFAVQWVLDKLVNIAKTIR